MELISLIISMSGFLFGRWLALKIKKYSDNIDPYNNGLEIIEENNES